MAAAAVTGLKGNAVQNRDYTRSCESHFEAAQSSPLPVGREGVRQGQVRRPASAMAHLSSGCKGCVGNIFFQDYNHYCECFRATGAEAV